MTAAGNPLPFVAGDANRVRARLPQPEDRLPLGVTGLEVSPVCLGLVGDPDIVPAAYERGINFFFLTADLHWPLYRHLRKGLERLIRDKAGVRDDIVVGVVSYLDEPMFRYLQFHEVLQSVAGLERVDLVIAGAVPNAESFNARYGPMLSAREQGHYGIRSVGSSFHDRATARASLAAGLLDIHYIRYNSGHPGARHDVFPHVPADGKSLLYNFTSTFSQVSPEQVRALGLAEYWVPSVTDHYRFVLSEPAIDGILCAPRSVAELDALCECLAAPPLSGDEQEYLMWLSSISLPQYF